jgi:hypothetical protein
VALVMMAIARECAGTTGSGSGAGGMNGLLIVEETNVADQASTLARRGLAHRLS